MATKDRVEKWTRKYGTELLQWLADVKDGKCSLETLSKKMNVSKECARHYFHKYYSDRDLQGTRFIRSPIKDNKLDVLIKEVKEIRRLLEQLNKSRGSRNT